jgi:hypothetical protein
MDAAGMEQSRREKAKFDHGCDFVFTAPSGFEDEIIHGDRVMCLLEQAKKK